MNLKVLSAYKHLLHLLVTTFAPFLLEYKEDGALNQGNDLQKK